MKDAFYFIYKALVLEILKVLHSVVPSFLPVYDVINCLNKNLITHFV